MQVDALLAAILVASALLASVNGQDDSKYEMDRDLKSMTKKTGKRGTRVGEKVGNCRLQVSAGWRR